MLCSCVRSEHDRQFSGFALIASVLANVNRDKRKKHTPFTPEDFMPKHRGSVIPQIPDGLDLFDQAKQLFGEPTL